MAWKPDYVTATQLRAYMRIGDTADDTELGYAVSAASRAVDSYTHRQFGLVAAAEDRFYTAEWDRRRRRWIVSIDDTMVAPTEVEILPEDDLTPGSGTLITDYTKEPINAAAKARPWERLVINPDATAKPTGHENQVRVKAQWGWSSFPTAVIQAALLQGSRFHARRQAPFGVAGSPETGSELRLLAKLDPDVAVSLRDYVRRWVAA